MKPVLKLLQRRRCPIGFQLPRRGLWMVSRLARSNSPLFSLFLGISHYL